MAYTNTYWLSRVVRFLDSKYPAVLSDGGVCLVRAGSAQFGAERVEPHRLVAVLDLHEPVVHVRAGLATLSRHVEALVVRLDSVSFLQLSNFREEVEVEGRVVEMVVLRDDQPSTFGGLHAFLGLDQDPDQVRIS